MKEVILSGFSPDPDHKKVHKTALGAQDSVPWRRIQNLALEIERFRSEGVTIAALEVTDSSLDIRTVSREVLPMMLIAGNEVDGVPQAILDLCDCVYEIPQFGVKQSLNVSVATAIAMYEFIS